MTKTMAEVIREELRKGSYQMPGDTLPYETQAAAVAAALTAAGYGLVADAEAKVKYAIESEGRAWRALDRLYDITPKEYSLGDSKESAVARAISHLINLRARAAEMRQG